MRSNLALLDKLLTRIRAASAAVLFAMLVSGCGGASWGAMGCGTVTNEVSLVGLTADQIQRELGAPSTQEQFTLSDGVHEFRIGLLNIYTLDEDGDRAFREETWHDGGCRLTLWSTQEADEWVVKDGLIWPAEAEF